MATVESWFGRFVIDLMAALPRPDWPISNKDFWERYDRAFKRHGITEIVLDEAVQLLAEAPPKFLDQVLPELLARTKEVWKQSEIAGRAEIGSRENAYLQSRECIDCGGMGLASRFRHESLGPGRAEVVVFYCLCPMGRWTEHAHRTGEEQARDVHRRIPDLADQPKLQMGPVEWSDDWDNRFRYRLADWDLRLNRPLTRPDGGRRTLTLKRIEEADYERTYTQTQPY